MENKNGQGIFLGVVGVATLVVAIIGATFAFFSAQAQSGDGDIGGNTLDVADTALKLDVKKITFTDTPANANNSLVPAEIDVSNLGIKGALNSKCVSSDNYTGCHVYRIRATSTNRIDSARLYLTLSTDEVGSAAISDWKYAIFTGSVAGTDGEVDGYTGNSNSVTLVQANSSNMAGSFPVTGTNLDLHQAAPLTAGTASDQGAEYFLIVYLANQTWSQNKNTDATKNATGSYSGVVTLQAGAAGQISATFQAAQS